MSNIGKRKIQIPTNTKISYDSVSRLVTIQGDLGTSLHKLNKHIDLVIKDSFLELSSTNGVLWGTENAIITNKIKGISQGFIKTLKLVGIGYRVVIKDNTLVFKLGFSHIINYKIPEGIQVSSKKPDTLTFFSIQNDFLSTIINQIRLLKKPDLYKGKGIRFQNEIIRLKEGKKK
jgi:large subunit ribosomal protein L6